MRRLILALVLVVGFAGLSQNSAEGKSPASFVMQPAPMQVPDVVFKDRMGRSITLKDFRGKLVVLNFWASWCAPCLEEMPELSKLQHEYGPRGLEVVAVSEDQATSLERALAVVERYYQRVGIFNLPVYLDMGMSAIQAFMGDGLPMTVILNSEGREIARVRGVPDWGSKEVRELIESGLPALPKKE